MRRGDRMFVSALCAFAVAVAGHRQVVSIPVHYVAVGPLMHRLVPNGDSDQSGAWRSPLVPDLVLRADAKANAVLAEGPAKSIEEFRRLLAMFDVAPQRVAMSIVYGIPQYGLRTEQNVSVANNDRYSASEEAAEFGMSVRPRINGDGTVTLFLDIHRGETKVSFVSRVKVGWSLYMKSPYLVARYLDHEPTDQELRVLDPPAFRDPKAGNVQAPNLGVLVWIKVNDLIPGASGTGIISPNPAKLRD